MIRSFPAILCWTAISLILGCSDNGPQVGYVEGEVSLAGEPLSGAMILFTPVEPGRPSLAVTDENGKYVLTFSATKQGATVGDHLVSITTERDANFDDRGAVTVAAVPELVPKEFNRESTQRVTVEAGKNMLDFHIPAK